MVDPADILARVCSAIENDHPLEAKETLATEYPLGRGKSRVQLRRPARFGSVKLDATPRPPISNATRMTVFVRDGFLDRYTGHRLVLPATLRLLSHFLAPHFPYNKNWAAPPRCHEGYWELQATIDHVDAWTRGGVHDESNFVTVCQDTNNIKGNIAVSDLGWTICEPGDLQNWDGLSGWYLRHFEPRQESYRRLLVEQSSDPADRRLYDTLSEWKRIIAPYRAMLSS